MIEAFLSTASQARVQTPKARNYLVQLCKHFAPTNEKARIIDPGLVVSNGCPAYFGLQNTMKSSVCFGMFFSEPMYFA